MGTSCDKRTGKKSHGPMTARVVQTRSRIGSGCTSGMTTSWPGTDSCTEMHLMRRHRYNLLMGIDEAYRIDIRLVQRGYIGTGLRHVRD